LNITSARRALVDLSTMSALRDETAFWQPANFDISATDLSRTCISSLGGGPHRCNRRALPGSNWKSGRPAWRRVIPQLGLVGQQPTPRATLASPPLIRLQSRWAGLIVPFYFVSVYRSRRLPRRSRWSDRFARAKTVLNQSKSADDHDIPHSEGDGVNWAMITAPPVGAVDRSRRRVTRRLRKDRTHNGTRLLVKRR